MAQPALLGRPGLDLDEDQDLSLQHDEIELIGAGPPVGREDGTAFPTIMGGGVTLPLRPKAPIPLPPTPITMPPCQEIHAPTSGGSPGLSERRKEGVLT